MRRILLLTSGLAILGFVVLLGYLSAINPLYVPWFGIASAVLAPVGLSILGKSLSSDSRKMLTDLSRLSTIPEISRLIAEAETQEARVRLLQEQQHQLEELIKYETERRALELRKDFLEKDAIDILKELNKVNKALESLTAKNSDSLVMQQLQDLYVRLETEEGNAVSISLRNKTHVFHRKDFKWFSIYGDLVYAFLSDYAEYQRTVKRRKAKKKTNINT